MKEAWGTQTRRFAHIGQISFCDSEIIIRTRWDRVADYRELARVLATGRKVD